MLQRASVSVLVVGLIASSALFAKEPPTVTYAKRLKGQQYVMRVHEALLSDSLRVSEWDGRIISEGAVSFSGSRIIIGFASDWEGRYYVSERTYLIKNVDYKGNADQLKMKVRDLTGIIGREIQLFFAQVSTLSVEDFQKMFFTLFFNPGENIDAYVKRNEEKLIQAYISGRPEFQDLSPDEHRQIVRAFREIDHRALPEFEEASDGLYIPISLTDASVYNDLQVSKNQRIASSIEAQVSDIRRSARTIAKLPTIKGAHFYWIVYHRNFLKDSQSSQEKIDLFVPTSVLSDFAEGNLSSFELVHSSFLKYDGTKFTLTTYDPIGAR